MKIINNVTIRTIFFAIGLVVISLLQLQSGVLAQSGSGTKTTPVVVTNTPTVEARQSGSWNVALEGTPTFKIDPNNNTVRLDPSAKPIEFHGYSFDWFQGRIFGLSQSTLNYSRLKVCVQHEPTGLVQQDAIVSVRSRILLATNSFVFDIGRFAAPAYSPACNVYELPGPSIIVSIEGVNTSGTVSVGLFGQSN